MCLTWMLLCLFLRQSVTQNPAPEGGKLPHAHPGKSIFIVVKEKKRERSPLRALTEKRPLTCRYKLNIILKSASAGLQV